MTADLNETWASSGPKSQSTSIGSVLKLVFLMCQPSDVECRAISHAEDTMFWFQVILNDVNAHGNNACRMLKEVFGGSVLQMFLNL